MAEDIAPYLYDEIESIFRNALNGDKKASALLKKIDSGTAKYSDAGYYAEEVGTAMNTAFKSTLSSDVLPDGKMYWNIAERTIEPLYEESYILVSQAVTDVQQTLNTAAGIGLKAQTVQYDQNVAQNIMNELCAADNYDDVAYKLYESADMYTRSVVDDTLKENVDFQGKSGRQPRIIRTAEAGCCEWCASLEGTYSYPGVPEDVYRRHNNCRCDVEYDPGTGDKTQNVHTKQWTTPEDRAKIEERKNFTGLNTNADRAQLRTINNNREPLKMDLQFFGSSPERDLYKQSSTSLQRGIRNSEKQISIHEDKIKNPEKYYPEWNQMDSRTQEGYIKHWQKEINNFQESNERRRNELRKREVYNE